MDFDCVVIGAGAVGLACAYKLSLSGKNVLVIEKHNRNGVETSSRNSGVIHAGMYYPQGSLKAQMCFEANQKLYEFCAAARISHHKIGKYIVAATKAEESRLEEIMQRGQSNGVMGLRYASKAELQSNEPYIQAEAAIYSPETGIIDVHGFLDALEENCRNQGVSLAFAHEVISIDRRVDGYRIEAICNGELCSVDSTATINAAGLSGDKIATLAGIDIEQAGYKLHYCKGHYFSVRDRKAKLVSHLIYPIPPANMAGLGVHITLDLTGRMRLGPDTLYIDSNRSEFSVPEKLRQSFYDAARWYFPNLEIDDLEPDFAGIRPKLQGPNDGYRDFVICEESAKALPQFINLIGIESPGLTCALKIGEKVTELLA